MRRDGESGSGFRRAGWGRSAIRAELLAAVALVSLLFLLHALAERRQTAAGIGTARYVLADRFRTPVLRIAPSDPAQRKGAAVLVHGFQCNKSMMAQLGRSLAARGMDVHAIDLPGHGESHTKFTRENNFEAARQAVAEIAGAAGGKPIVLVGHSWGCQLLGPVALERRDIAASIFLGPGEVEGMRPDRPRNVLILTAEHDYEFVKAAARKAFDGLTGRSGSTPGGARVGDAAGGSARAWEEVPRAAHVDLLFSEEVYRKVGDWSGQALETTLPAPRPSSLVPVAFEIAVALALCAILASLVPRPFPVRTEEDGTFPRGRLRTSLSLGYWALFGAVAANFFAPLRFVRLLEGQTLASSLLVAGVSGWIFVLAVERRLAAPAAPEVLRDAAVASLVFCALYLSATYAVEGELYHVALLSGDPGRLRAFAAVAAGSLPFFLLAERLLRQIQRRFRGFLRGAAASCAAAALLYALFPLASLATGSRLHRFSEALLPIMVYCALVGAIFHGRLRSTLAGALFTSLVAAWMISVGFIRY